MGRKTPQHSQAIDPTVVGNQSVVKVWQENALKIEMDTAHLEAGCTASFTA
jgi:hypothetical protein